MLNFFNFLFIFAPIASIANVCKIEINPLQKTVCEVQLKINKCEEIKSKHNDPQLLSHFETCRAQSTNGEISRAAINCTATFMLVGTYTLPKLAPAIATTVSKLPAALTKVGARIFAGLTILGPLVSTYTIGSMLNDGLEIDKACFNNVELKTNYLNFAKKKSEYLKEKLQAHLADFEKRQIAFPEEYLKEGFIKNLPCSRMFEILREQDRKQTPIVGKLLAQKKIQTDPRDELPISDEETQEINTLKNVVPCLSPAKQAEIVCAISNLIVGGTRLTAELKEFTRTPSGIKGLVNVKNAALGSHAVASNFAAFEKIGASAKGYHASPVLDIKVFDPALSRNTNKYGPGSYFYLDKAKATEHANSIRSGNMKYDKTPRPAKIYEARVDLSRTLEVERTYTRDEIKGLIESLNKTKPGLFGEIPTKITGDELYAQITAVFAAGKKISLSRGVQGEVSIKSLTNKFLVENGFTTIVGKVPDPNTKIFYPAYISLKPLKPNN